MRTVLYYSGWLLLLVGLGACRETPTTPLTCTTSFVDPRDGQVYCTATIGNQRWLAQNLRVSWLGAMDHPAHPHEGYGRLYTHAAALQACPSGWHLPTEAEWQALEATLGMDAAQLTVLGMRGTDQGARLKASTDWWADSSSGTGRDADGFHALPAGLHNPSFGPYLDMGKATHFWTATPSDTSGGVWIRSLYHDAAGIERTYRSEQLGLSCRCVED